MRYMYDADELKIMIAEEDPETRNDLLERIGRYGETISCETGSPDETLMMVKRKRPDLIFMNVAFGGGKGGIEIAEKIETTLEIPIVFIVNPGEKDQLNDMKSVHALGYLVKPFQEEEISAIIQAVGYVRRLNGKREQKGTPNDDQLSYLKRLRRMGYELAVTEERGRRRIAFELHNNVGQCLSLLKMKMKEGPDSEFQPEPEGFYEEILELIDRIDTETQYLISELSPPILYDLGLKTALKWLTDHISENHGLNIFFEDYDAFGHIDDENNIILFRIIRELLENVVKHAKASSVNICFYSEAGYQVISVEDDGIGLVSSDINDSADMHYNLGIFCIKEILFYLGGHVDIKSSPGKGTRFRISLPLRQTCVAHSVS